METSKAIDALKNLGLSQKEAEVYIASLKGAATPALLAERTGLKRPTVYVITDNLKQKGYVSETKKGSKTFFTALDPDVFARKAQEDLKIVEEVLPSLKSLLEQQPGRPRIDILEGKQGIKNIYSEMLLQKEVVYWSNISGVKDQFPEALNEFMSRVKSKRLQARELVGDSSADRSYAREIKRMKLPNYEVRIAQDFIFKADCMIYGSTIVMVSLKADNLIVVRIQNVELADSLRILFELAWRGARTKKVKGL